MTLPQDPPAPGAGADALAQLQALGWVDHTALAVLLVFFVLGLFKGLIWQISRIGILLAAYVVAGRFGHDVAAWFGGGAQAPEHGIDPAGGAPEDGGETSLYLAYVLLFLAVLIVLSLVAMVVKKLADKAGLGFFDRVGGGVLGVATGACVVLALVFVVRMFFPGSRLAEAAESSHSLRLSQRAIDWLGAAVDDDLRVVLNLQRLGPEPQDDASGRGSPACDGVSPKIPGGNGEKR